MLLKVVAAPQLQGNDMFEAAVYLLPIEHVIPISVEYPQDRLLDLLH